MRTAAYPYADAENLGHAVIDIKRLEADYDDYCTVNRIGHSVMNSFSFASFDRYLEKSQVSKKVNSGFSINLGLFSILDAYCYQEFCSHSSICQYFL